MRDFLVFMVSVCVCAVGVGFGSRFIKLGNYLLGYEWFILALSSACGLVFLMGRVPIAGSMLHYFDLFSRLLGIPLIAGVGLLKVTHDYEPSKFTDAALFFSSLLFCVWLFNHPRFAEFSQVIEQAETIAFAGFMFLLLFITHQCFKYQLWKHGLVMIAANVLGIYAGMFGDILELAPQDHLPLRLDDFVLSYVSWIVAFSELYFVYVALARAKGIELPGITWQHVQTPAATQGQPLDNSSEPAAGRKRTPL